MKNEKKSFGNLNAIWKKMNLVKMWGQHVVALKRSGFKTQKEAKQAYRELQIDFDKNKLKQKGNITFEKLYEEFLQSYRNKVKPSTIMILRRAIEDYALQYIGKKKIKDINVRLCTRMNEEWVSDGYKQAYYFRRAVAQILQYAVQQELIYENAMRKTAPINRAEIDENLVDTETINVYIPKELSEFLHYSQKHGNYFRTLAYTGARKSEILALEWNDVDFENSKLTISKTLAEVELNPKTKKTNVESAKTNAGKRTISIDTETISLLKNGRNSKPSTIPFKASTLQFHTN